MEARPPFSEKALCQGKQKCMRGPDGFYVETRWWCADDRVKLYGCWEKRMRVHGGRVAQGDDTVPVMFPINAVSRVQTTFSCFPSH